MRARHHMEMSGLNDGKPQNKNCGGRIRIRDDNENYKHPHESQRIRFRFGSHGLTNKGPLKAYHYANVHTRTQNEKDIQTKTKTKVRIVWLNYFAAFFSSRYAAFSASDKPALGAST